MPPQFTLPPDTRAVGTGNPPADVNALIDAATASGTGFNVLNTAYAGGADPAGVADSTAAFQACMTAAIAVSGEMTIPPGTYNLNTGNLNITGPCRIRGLGAGLGNQSGVSTPAPAVILNCSGAAGGSQGSASMFKFPGQGYLWGGFSMQGIGIIYTGTGDVFFQCIVTDSIWQDMLITLTAPGSRAFFTVTDGGHLNNAFLNNTLRNVNITTTAPTRTAPMISLSATNGGAVSNTTYERCKFSNNGLDNTQYMIYMACTGAGSAYHFADNIRDCWFEHPFGGAYQSLSGQDVTIDGCMAWDMFSGQTGGTTTVAAGSNGGTISGIAAWATPSAGVLAVASTAGFPAAGTLNVAASGSTTAVVTYTGVSGNTLTGCAYVSGSPAGTVATGGTVTWTPTVGNSLYYIGAYPGNSGSQGTRITGCGRNRNGPNGTTTWDVYAEATSSQTQIECYTVKPDSVSTTTNAFFNFNGHPDVTLINNQSPQGSGVNGNSTTVITGPSPNQVTIGNGIVSASTVLTGGWAPQDSAWLEYNFDPALISTSTALGTAGVLNLIRVNIRAVRSVTNVIVYLGTLGATLTSGQCFAGLYSSAGTLIGTSADQTATWNTGGSTGLKTIALTGGPFTIQPGFTWVALLFNGTTGPSFGRGQSVNATAAQAGVAASAARWATNSSAQTSLPSTITVSGAGNTIQQVTYFAALS